MSESRIVIIGGGIAGLSAAYYAIKKVKLLGLPARVSLFESDVRWGGKITTERVGLDGGQFIVEGGPDTFLATKPWAAALCRELGLENRLHGTNPKLKNTYVLHHDRLMLLPDGLAMMIPTNIPSVLRSGLVSWLGKLRMGLDFILPPAHPNGDESLGAFVSRRLGREAYENLIEPLMSGIYAGDGDALSLASTFPYLRDLELKYGSLARGALSMRKLSSNRPVQGSRSAFLTPTTGLAELVEALVAFLSAEQADLQLGKAISAIRRDDDAYQVMFSEGEALHADCVILATPAYCTAKLLEKVDPQMVGILKSIPYASTATISLGYRQADLPRPLDGYGYIIPRRERRETLACTWTSTKFPHRAPQGYALLRVFIGRAGQEKPIPQDPRRLENIAREELKQTLGILAEPVMSRVFIWEDSMPQYNLGHPERLSQITERLEHHPRLALAGGAYRGIGIPDCIHSAELAVERVLQPIHAGQAVQN